MVFFIVQGIAGSAEEATIDLVCKASINGRARSVVTAELKLTKTVTVAKAQLATLPFLCKTQRMDIVEVIKEIYGSKTKPTKNKIIEQFTKAMASCWGTFAEGRYPMTIEDKGSRYESVCFPC